MFKRIFLFALLSSSVLSFEKSAELFGSKDYYGSTKAFLSSAKINDVRTPYYIHFMAEKGLVNPQELEASLQVKWNEHITRHASLAPVAIGKGDVYLKISLLAQELIEASNEKATGILAEIKTISNDHQIGYGYYVVGQFLEKQAQIKNLNKVLATQIQSAYTIGCEYAHGLSVLALQALPEKYPKFLGNLNIKTVYTQEYKVLSTNQTTITLGESLLSKLHDGKNDPTYGKFSADGSRKKLWQLEAARQGDPSLQMTVYDHAPTIQQEFKINPIRKDESDRWLYFAALGGHPVAQALVGEYYFYADKPALFPKNNSLALLFSEAPIDYFMKNRNQATDKYLNSSLMIAGNLLDKETHSAQNVEKAFKYYKLAADNFNDPIAVFNTACMLENDRGTVKNEKAAREYYEKAFFLGSADAACAIADALFNKLCGYEKNHQKAMVYLNIATSKGNPNATWESFLIYGHHYSWEKQDYPVKQDEARSLDLLKKAAQLEHPKAQAVWIDIKIGQREILSEEEAKILVQCLEAQHVRSTQVKAWYGLLLKNGYRDLIPQNKERALALLREAEKENDELATIILGSIHEQGECGVDQNYTIARQYYERAPKNAEAVATLGYLYEKGYGGVKDSKKALELYQKACEMGGATAANNLGAFYNKKQDHANALYYYKLGYERKDPDASYQYATYLYEGKYCNQNREEAAEIFLKLAPSVPAAAYSSAALRFNEDTQQSLYTFAKLAEDGLPVAQYAHGLFLYIYSLENNLWKNYSLKASKKYIERSKENGFEHANSALRLLINRPQNNKDRVQLIVQSLLAGEIDRARSIVAEDAQERDSKSEEEYQINSSLEISSEELMQRDPDAAKKRQKEYLEYFLDPVNKKKISLEGLYKIAGSQISEKGGEIAPTKGSGIKIEVGNSTLGLHKMHRANQSSNATLDPGRVNSIREFVKEINN